MKLSRTVSYAVQAILELSQEENGRPMPCRDIAKMRDMPERFLLQILRNLVTHGILVSVRGVDGGYSLKRPINDITLLHLIEATEGPIGGSVPTGGKLSTAAKASLCSICDEIAALTRVRLDKVTIKDLISSECSAKLPATVPGAAAISLMALNVGSLSECQVPLSGSQHA